MELGNMVFGHSRGVYDFDAYSDRAKRDDLLDMMNELGITVYGQPSHDITVLHDRHIEPSWMTGDNAFKHVDGEDWRRIDIVDPGTGDRILTFRSYWWGDTDTEEDAVSADLPNLEFPAQGLQIRWYKYYGRDSYTNIPLTDELIDDIRMALTPALEEAHRYLPHKEQDPNDIVWREYEGNLSKYEMDGTLYMVFPNAYNDDRYPDRRKYYDSYRDKSTWVGVSETVSGSPVIRRVGVFDTEKEARGALEQQMRTIWVDPDGNASKPSSQESRGSQSREVKTEE